MITWLHVLTYFICIIQGSEHLCEDVENLMEENEDLLFDCLGQIKSKYL